MTRPDQAARDTATHHRKTVVFGQPQFAAINRRLNERFARRGTLVAVHRGTGQGTIVENTVPAVIAATRSGADLVEIDVVRSRDGAYFAFHDGYEPWHFGIDQNLQTLSSEQIGQLAYRQRITPPLVRVERLETILTDAPEVSLNVDRSWRYWPVLLDHLDGFDVADRLLLKVDATDDRALEAARRHHTKFPLLPICKDLARVEQLVADPDLNVVGIELVAADSSHPFCDPAWVRNLRLGGTFSYMNALDLGNDDVLFAGWDDTVSVLDNPDRGWGKLVDVGADVIQTDWPSLLDAYLTQCGARTAAGSAAGRT